VQADAALLAANKSAQGRLTQIIEEEKLKAAEERQSLLSQMTTLIHATAEAQDNRLASKVLTVNDGIDSSHAAYKVTHDAYNQGMDTWSGKSKDIIGDVVKSRDNVKMKIKADFAVSTLFFETSSEANAFISGCERSYYLSSHDNHFRSRQYRRDSLRPESPHEHSTPFTRRDCLPRSCTE
jgi:hypothetical protein